MKHIQLADSEPRCRNRSKACEDEGKCARARAPVPAKGATIGDFSLEIVTITTPLMILNWCRHFTPASFDAAPSGKPAAKPWIGEAA